jgi:hypothetical protein
VTTIHIKDLDIVYLSYDEPNAEQNWQQLLDICPWAQRVHGIKGSDAAHKACADLASTDRFITIDGDNQINPLFLEQSFEFGSEWDITQSILSFSAENVLNGLAYGNGGIKCWPKQVVVNMRTHELADGDNSSVDFCWALDYVLMPGMWSRSIINSTPAQAWRAGFREGVKLSLIDGLVESDPDTWKEKLAKSNKDRLLVWQQVGADQPNGLWAILGARQGCWRTMLTDWNAGQVQDFDHLDWLWEKEESNVSSCHKRIQDLGKLLNTMLDLPIAADPFSAAQSTWFKSIWRNPSRSNPQRLKR